MRAALKWSVTFKTLIHEAREWRQVIIKNVQMVRFLFKWITTAGKTKKTKSLYTRCLCSTQWHVVTLDVVLMVVTKAWLYRNIPCVCPDGSKNVVQQTQSSVIALGPREQSEQHVMSCLTCTQGDSISLSPGCSSLMCLQLADLRWTLRRSFLQK